MAAAPKRLGVKFSLKPGPKLEPKDIMPIFQRWIQEHTVEGMLIDVIDYKHVHQGPSLILIADEGDYAYDLGDGQAGLQYIRKRAMPSSLSDALRLVFRLAFIAARRLEVDAKGRLRFDYAAAKISFLDRRHYRNQPGGFDNVRAELTAFLAQLYDDEIELTRVYDDPRQIFALRCSVQNPDAAMAGIISRLEGGKPPHNCP